MTTTGAPRARSLGVAALFLLRLGLATVFIVAAIPKIQAPDLFAGDVYNYQMLPPWAVNILALVLPWFELLLGLGLALGIWSRTCALVAAAMMLVFMIAYASARARGLDIACGCFERSGSGEAGSAIWVVLRDLGLLASALVLARWHGSAPSPIDLLRRTRRRGATGA